MISLDAALVSQIVKYGIEIQSLGPHKQLSSTEVSPSGVLLSKQVESITPFTIGEVKCDRKGDN